MEDEPELGLDEGDFLYQPDQELFLVVMEDSGESLKLAAHGWRDISKTRLDEYLNGKHGKLYRREDLADVIEQKHDDELEKKFARLEKLFEMYKQDIDEDGAHTEFTMEDT